MEDWLSADLNSAANDEQRREQIAFARKYLVFEDDPRAKDIFNHWKKVMLYKRTPVDANVQTYAADEAVRAFIAGVVAQLEIAKDKE